MFHARKKDEDKIERGNRREKKRQRCQTT